MRLSDEWGGIIEAVSTPLEPLAPTPDPWSQIEARRATMVPRRAGGGTMRAQAEAQRVAAAVRYERQGLGPAALLGLSGGLAVLLYFIVKGQDHEIRV